MGKEVKKCGYANCDYIKKRDTNARMREEFIIKHYFREMMSSRDCRITLGMSESGFEKLTNRLKKQGYQRATKNVCKFQHLFAECEDGRVIFVTEIKEFENYGFKASNCRYAYKNKAHTANKGKKWWIDDIKNYRGYGYEVMRKDESYYEKIEAENDMRKSRIEFANRMPRKFAIVKTNEMLKEYFGGKYYERM